MTSIPVNSVNALLNNLGSQTQTVPVTEDSVKESFDQIMGKLNEEVAGLSDQSVAKNQGVNQGSAQNPVKSSDSKNQNADTTQKAESKQKVDDKESSLQNKQAKLKNSAGDKAVKETKDVQTETQVKEAADQLVKDVAEIMNVTPDQVLEAMQTLGISELQLFDTDNLKQLLMQISGNEDAFALVTDEVLYGQLQDLFKIADETFAALGTDLELADEQLKALLDEMNSAEQETNIIESQPQILTEEGNQIGEKNTPVLEGMKNYSVSVHKDGETVSVQVDVDDVTGEESVAKEVVTVEKTAESGDENNGFSNKNSKDENNSRFQDMIHNPMQNALQNAVQEQPVTETQEIPMNSQLSQTNEIMDQIMEYMKVNLKAETQELEMQLHPASLGAVNVQLTAKDGIITAQFTTQNEAVRAAVESQLIQLKEQFEEQGIRVDSVEVTVANHAYGDQYSQDSEQPKDNQNSSKKTVRKINLDELDEEESIDEMEEADRITVEMMRQNGNSVDYTA